MLVKFVDMVRDAVIEEFPDAGVELYELEDDHAKILIELSGRRTLFRGYSRFELESSKIPLDMRARSEGARIIAKFRENMEKDKEND